MSRAEIVAAARALRRDARRRTQTGAFGASGPPAVAVAALVSDCAAQVLAGQVYRSSLVTRLQNRIETGTYTVPADDIADQLLGRLLAAALAT